MKRRLLLSLAFPTFLAMGACSPQPVMNTPEQVGGATPAQSPSSGKQLDGDIVLIDGAQAIEDVDAIGSVLAVRTDKQLMVGSPESIKAGEAFTTEITGCEELTTSGGNNPAFIVPCGENIRVIPAQQPEREEVLAVEGLQVTSAVRVPSGEIIAASHNDNVVRIIQADGSFEEFKAAAPTDQLVVVGESPVRINRGDSTIQNLDWQQKREGGRLRIGVGVGKISSGSPDEVIVAADTLSKQMAVYTSGTVVRLHQLAPVDGTPWGAAWDGELAWVTTTDNNKAYGFDISTGQPVQKEEISTIADAHSIAAGDGFVAIGSATSGDLQIVSK